MAKPVYRETEAQIQGRTVEWLRALGFIVQVTNAGLAPARYSRGENKGDLVLDGDGKKVFASRQLSTPGVPDLLVSHRQWPAFVWLGIEMKRDDKAPIRPEQQALADLGRVLICWDDNEAVKAVRAFHQEVVNAA